MFVHKWLQVALSKSIWTRFFLGHDVIYELPGATNIYHTEHFFSGFILLPKGQLKSFAKFSLLDKVPVTRNRSGAWAPVKICCLRFSVRDLEHQTCPKLIQNIWLGEYGRPTIFGSSWWSATHCTEIKIHLSIFDHKKPLFRIIKLFLEI